MDPIIVQIVIAVCTVLAAVVGSSLGAYVTIRVTVAVLREVVARHDEEIRGFRRWRHELTEKLSAARSQEILDFLRKDKP